MDPYWKKQEFLDNLETQFVKYRKKPVEVDATQWFKLGDHPEVITLGGQVITGPGGCRHCGLDSNKHGWVYTLEGGHIVCPGDFVITGVQGEHYPCKPDIFEETYEVALSPSRDEADDPKGPHPE
jgi:hypothetical protein